MKICRMCTKKVNKPHNAYCSRGCFFKSRMLKNVENIAPTPMDDVKGWSFYLLSAILGVLISILFIGTLFASYLWLSLSR
jgi:hypothetical protein